MTAAALSDLQQDALKEIGNIGAGHAVTALSELLNARIGLVEPHIEVLRFGELRSRLDRDDRPIAALHMDVKGEAPGEIFVFFDREQAAEFVDRFIRRAVGDITIFESIAESTLKEIANILAGSYLTAIGHLTGVRLEPSVPELSFGTVRGSFADLASVRCDRPVFSVDSVFLDDGVAIGGEFVFIPEYQSLAPLLSIFGV